MRVNKLRKGFFKWLCCCGAFLSFWLLLSIKPAKSAAAEFGPFLQREIKAHQGAVTGVDISLDGKLIVSGGGDGRIVIWHVADGGKLHTLGEYKEVVDVSFAPDEPKVIGSAVDSRKKEVLHVWDYEKEKLREEIEGHTQRINAVAYSPNGKMIASGSSDNTLKTWYAGSGREIHTFVAKKNDFLSLGWAPDSEHLASGLSWDGNILVWDTGRDELELTLTGHSDWVNAVLYTPDGNRIISGSRDGSIRIWDASSGKELGKVRESWWGGINDLGISGDGLYLAGANEKGSVVVWYAADGKVLAVFNGHAGPVNEVAFSADGRTIVSGGVDGKVMVWTAPAAGGPEALFDLAAKHDQGTERIKKDKGEAFKWYLKSATGGYVRAMVQVGEMYGSGAGIGANQQQAVKWLTAAADKDDAEAMFLLGNIYASGQGVAVDQDKAAALWAKAAEKGHVEAGAKLSKKVEGLDLKSASEKSIAWLEKAAGSGDVKAMYDLALIYEKGSSDVAKDPAAVIRWFTEAAKLGNVEAQFKLGEIYATGAGVKKSGQEAVTWWRKASEQGHPEALYQLGLSYAEGNGVKKDVREAAKLLKKAAGKGNLAAKYRLGILYCTGKGVAQDYAAAVKLWKQAAGTGDVMSMYFLGYMYETGSGVKRNLNQARKYYDEAAKRGNFYADQARKQLD